MNLPITSSKRLWQPWLTSAILALSLPVLAQTANPASAPTEVLAPNSNLLVQGIPAIPMSMVARVAPYTEFSGHGLVGWHPKQRELLLSHRAKGSNTAQLFRIQEAGSSPVALTQFPDPVSGAHYEPTNGRYIVIEKSSGGNEVTQLFKLDPSTGQAEQLTDPNERHAFQGWLKKQGLMLVASVPLDRTAQGGTRPTINTVLRTMNPLKPSEVRELASLPGGGWGVTAISHDERTLALSKYVSANESEIWRMDLATGQLTQVLPSAADIAAKRPRAVHAATGFSRDDKTLFFVSDRDGEFRQAMALDMRTGAIRGITTDIPWDVSGFELTEDGRLIALQVNVDGRDELRLYDGRTLKALPTPALPPGSVGSTAWNPAGTELAFTLNSAKSPSTVYTVPISAQGASKSAVVSTWTKPYSAPGIDTSQFPDQQIIRWKSFDGRDISGLMSLPPARFAGKRPVLINIHGGPEGQATMGFLGRNNYLINELGIAMIQPNVRGSSGYGKTFLALDNGRLREDSVKDIGALLDWIATQPQLDASRVLVTGGSYGGYMSLAVSTHYADRIAGSIDVVGISHFVTFLQNTESYRRDLRRVEYGDERDPEMKAFLDRISPLTNAQKITKPLFVVQGKNDPRVPYTEAEQIVAKAREVGTPVWYLRAENEGHGFARKENADFQFYATLLFMQQTLLK